MSNPQPSVNVQDLLEHSQWVRELARRLARDPAAAEDIAQSTWLAALQHPPAEGRPLREWLGTVVRNFARQSRRGESRRDERERWVARPEALPSTADLLERASMQREVADAVMGLDEPYRTTILLRFFESLPPREIALRLGVPVETVSTRLTRGIEKLRVSLDEAHGGERRTWMLLLVPVTKRWVGPSSIAGTALVNAKLVATLTVVSALGLGAWWVGRPDGPRTRSVVVAAPVELELPAASERAQPEQLAPAAQAQLRTEVEAPVAEVPVAKPVAAAPIAEAVAPLAGVVLDADGRALPGIDLVVRGAAETSGAADLPLRSDGAGRFRLTEPPLSGSLGVADSASLRWTTVMIARFGPRRRPGDAVVVVAPRAGFSGTVVDEQGTLLVHARLTVELPADFRSRLNAVLDGSEVGAWQTVTDEHGRFELPEVPAVRDARLGVVSGGFDTYSGPLPATLGEDIVITLIRPSAGVLQGRVVDAAGRSIAGAQVALGADTRVSDADGAFAFELDDPDSFSARFGLPADSLMAIMPGFLPATFEPPGTGNERRWPGSVTLVLGEQPFGLEGRVTNHLGEPLSGARVWVMDTAFLGIVEGRMMHVEAYLAGSSRSWSFVPTDDLGRFKVTGLLDREYKLRAMDEATLLIEEFGPFQAGASSLELRLPTDRLYSRVAGRVVNAAGKPIPGVDVFPMCDAFLARARGRLIGTSHETLPGVVTDSEGRFELLSVPRSLVYLRADGDSILPNEYGRFVEERLDPDDPRPRGLPFDRIEQLEIVVEERCHLRVLLTDPASADTVGLLDPDGRELVLNVIEAGGRLENETMPVLAGRSEILAVPDTGTVVVLYLGGEEVGRLPVELVAGEVVEVTF